MPTRQFPSSTTPMADVASFMARDAARRLLADLGANGGALQRQPEQQDGLPRVLLTYAGAADRERCRRILVDAKADPAVWRAIICALPLPTHDEVA